MTTFTNESKSSASWSNTSKSATTFTNDNFSPEPAVAGLYYGFGAFTYAGGESVFSRGFSWVNETKH